MVKIDSDALQKELGITSLEIANYKEVPALSLYPHNLRHPFWP